jgi:hypothetical protein
MNFYECLNVIDDDVYDAIYYVHVNFTSVKMLLMMMYMMRHIVRMKNFMNV